MKTKRRIAIFIKTLSLFLLLPILLFLFSYISGWGYFEIRERDGVLFNYIGFGRTVTIPDNVTAIAHNVFINNRTMKTVIIPDSVTEIDGHAFAYALALENVYIPDSVLYMDSSVFNNCISLKTVRLPKYLEIISGGMFFNCISLESLIIPEGVTTIGEAAFTNCKSLETIHIPKSVIDIRRYPFGYCFSLSSITVDELNPRYLSIDGVLFGNAGFEDDGLNPDMKILIRYPVNKKDNVYFIPDNVSIIHTSAISEAINLTEVHVPNSVNIIRSSAFYGCINLTDIFIPESVEIIEKNAFGECENLTIHGIIGSYAEEYAISNNIPFIPIP
jgi:hypothetical protein